MDFFFILSGFLISKSYESKIVSWESFWVYIRNRFFRIYPLLLFSTIIFLFALLVSNLIFPQLIHNSSSVYILLYQAFDTLLLTNSTPILGDGLGLNFPAWSISSEMISYLIFGVVIRIIPSSKRTLVVVALVIICFLFLLSQERYFLTGSWGFVRGLLCFNLGYVVYLVSKREFVLSSIFELISGITLIILFYFLHQNNFTVQRELLALVFVPPLFALFILVVLKSNGMISKLLVSQSIQYVGKISYSIYLNHALIIVVIPRILFDLLLIERTNLHLILSLLLVVFILLIYSKFTYKFIEQGIGHRLKSLFIKPESY